MIATVTIVISTASPSSGCESESCISSFVHLKKETCIKPDDCNNFRFIMPSKYWGDGLAEAPPPAEDAGVALQASHVNIGTVEARPSHRLEEPQLHTPSRGSAGARCVFNSYGENGTKSHFLRKATFSEKPVFAKSDFLRKMTFFEK